MTILDYALMAVLISGSFYVLYRSLWKKPGRKCHGCCDNGLCDKPRR